MAFWRELQVVTHNDQQQVDRFRSEKFGTSVTSYWYHPGNGLGLASYLSLELRSYAWYGSGMAFANCP